MFFLIRCAICVGIVAMMASGTGAGLGTGDLASATRIAAAGVARYCASRDDCAAQAAQLARHSLDQGDASAGIGLAARAIAAATGGSDLATRPSASAATEPHPAWRKPGVPHMR